MTSFVTFLLKKSTYKRPTKASTGKKHFDLDVENIVKKAGKRLYMLYQLKRAGITQKDLVSVYVSVGRPV